MSPPDDTDWRIEADAFVAALRDRRPDAPVRWASDPGSTDALDFLAILGPQRVNGWLARDGQALWLEGDLPDVASVAIWFREIVPSPQPLLLYDEAMQGTVELATGRNSAETGAAYLADVSDRSA